MEPRKQDLEQTPQARPEEKKRRFRIDKLEDRIAPAGVGNGFQTNWDNNGNHGK